MSTRRGGVSPPPWDSLNLRDGLGDDPACVAENRRRFVEALSAQEPVHPVPLDQVHGVAVVRLDSGSLQQPRLQADAAWTDVPGMACEIQVADCLPVLLCVDDGRAVAAAHAGWRGLAAGVLEATVDALSRGAAVPTHRLLAWLGPCIGPTQFEVTAEVLQAFGRSPEGQATPAFRPQGAREGRPRWLADLPALAAERLRGVGVERVFLSGRCTASEPSWFFSHRRDGRDGRSGRQAVAIWRRG